MPKTIKRNESQAREAVGKWWNDPKHERGRDADTATDDPNDPAHNEPPRGLDPKWREVAPGVWKSDDEEED